MRNYIGFGFGIGIWKFKLIVGVYRVDEYVFVFFFDEGVLYCGEVEC